MSEVIRINEVLTIAEGTVRRVVAVLEPLEVAADYTGRVGGDYAVLTDVDAVLETEEIRHLPLGTFAQAHHWDWGGLWKNW